jgi:hypothetical protein
MKLSSAGLVVFAAGLLLTSLSGTSSAQSYGHVTGQFVLDGAVPNIAPVKPGEKDAAVCAKPDLPDNRLIVDEETKGIANVLIYLKKKPNRIHPDLKESKEKTVVFDQKNCRFEPIMLLVRTDQTVLVKSDDPINHNTHTHPFANPELNFLIRPNDRDGVPVEYKVPEVFPTKVNCDLHPHMIAYWMVLDHPYMALTDEEGKFKIENLPAGRYEFSVWHERVGWIDKALKVAIKNDATEDLARSKCPLRRSRRTEFHEASNRNGAPVSGAGVSAVGDSLGVGVRLSADLHAGIIVGGHHRFHPRHPIAGIVISNTRIKPKGRFPTTGNRPLVLGE